MGPRVYARMNNSPKCHGLSVRKISSPWLYCSVCNHSALVSKTPFKRRVSQRQYLCRNALAVTSAAAMFSGFSENQNSQRTWSTGLDSILYIKIDLGGHRVQVVNSPLLLSGRRDWQMMFPAEKPGEKMLSASRNRRSLSSPDRFLPGKRQVSGSPQR